MVLPHPYLIICHGLPGSGKTTWAKAYQQTHPGTKRVNRDDLRAMIDASVWSKANEAGIRDLRDHIIRYYLQAGHVVICDDTNLDTAGTDALCALAAECHVPVEHQDFRDVPVVTCHARNQQRTGIARVPDAVIDRMAATYQLV